MYVAVRSLCPPRLFLYRHWYARVANTPYVGSDPSDLTAHLTVAKYDGVEQEFVGETDLISRLTAASVAASATTFATMASVSSAAHSGSADSPTADSPNTSPPLADSPNTNPPLAETAGRSQTAAGHTALPGRPPFDWAGVVQPRLLSALAGAFRPLVERGEESLWGDGRSRALYGVDVIFAESSDWQTQRQQPGSVAAALRGAEEGGQAESASIECADRSRCDVQPVLLEVNYSADYAKMLEFRPSFVNDAFGRLFLDEEAEGGEEGQTLWQALPIE